MLTPVDHAAFSRLTPSVDWAAGLIAADGCVSSDRLWSISQSGEEGLARLTALAEILRFTRAIPSWQPTTGRRVHTLQATSPQMVTDMREHFGITRRKTLSYTWPVDVGADRAASFLRGYIEGDGCVGVYSQPNGSPFLHVSFVGTPEFIDAAMTLSPETGQVRRLRRCANLAEVRYNGDRAKTFGLWVFGDEGLPVTRKSRKLHDYLATARTSRRELAAAQRARTLSLLAAGTSLRSTASQVGVSVGTVCRWKAAASSTSQEAC